MKKNGFTLIELLAVVVVFAIILVVASPKIFNAVEESRKQTFLRSSETIVKEANKLFITDNLNITQNGKEFTITNKAFVGESLDVSGELPDSGKIYADTEGNTAISLTNGKYCTYKDFNDKEITVSSNIASCILNVPEVVPDSCFTRTNDGTKVTITDYNNTCSKNVIIPNTLDGLPVRIIGTQAFYQNQLTSIKLPDTITTLNTYAFYFNQLTSINIPNSLTTINYGSFENNKLTSLTIPNTVNIIGDYAFKSNQLTKISLPNTYINMGYGIFNNNKLPNETAFIYYKNLDGSDNTKHLNSYGGVERNNVIIPNGIETIGKYAVSILFLYGVQIPNTVTKIDEGAFQSTTFLENLVIPNSVTRIEQTAFNSSGIKNLTLSNNLQYIGRSAFLSNDISNLIIPNTVTTIESRAFASNDLTNVNIPSSVTYLGGGAFSENSFPPETAMIYARNSNGTENLSKLSSYSGRISSLVLPNNITQLDDYSLSDVGLTSLTLPSNLVVLGNQALYDNSLTNISLPNTLTTIGIYGLAKNNFTSLVIPSSVTSLNNYALYWNSSLTSVTLPSISNVNTTTLSSAFYTAYVTNNNRAAGTYLLNTQTGVWTKQP